jgi:hypothetical protein
MRFRGTGRSGAFVGVIAACAIGCSGTSAAPPPDSPDLSSPPVAQQLHLNFSNPPERWRTVATFGYGKRTDQLAPPGGSTGVSGPNGAAGGAAPLPPAAIAVADDSVWVLDQNNHRVAHFTLSGHYLGEVRDISPTARDVALYPSGRLLVSRHTPLVPTDTDVGKKSWAAEYAERFSWRVDLETLDVRMAPAWDRRYSFPGGHDVVLGVDSVQVAQRHTYFWLGVAGWRAGAGTELLLELDGQGNVASLERVATPRWAGSAEVHRPFYVAADGTVYQWFTTPTHAELRVRP